MTSPYSSNLLQKSTHEDAPRTRAPQRPAAPAPQMYPGTQMVPAMPQPMPVMYAPQPQQVVVKRSVNLGGAISGLALALVVLLVGAVALVGGYYFTQAAAPSEQEAAITTQLAMREGYVNARQQGLGLGRTDGADAVATTANLRASLERQKAWDAAYQRGMRAGNRVPQRSYYGGGGRSSSAPRASFGGFNDTLAAVGVAQQIANATGAPVDVQTFN